MNASDAQRASEIDAASRRVYLGAALIVLGALAAYANSLGGPFLFDDIGSIPENPTIRHLWPVWTALAPPSGGFTVSGRPVLNLSLAINYAISGTNVWSYHAVNLLIHILAGLTLFGIMRRTLERWSELPPTRSFDSENLAARTNFPMRLVGDNPPHLILAFAVALIWTVHPLQTESVTLVIQRAESLMGLFYLLTLYCFIRSVDQNFEIRNSKFEICSVLACLLGMATKEVMVTAPVIVLLYDRTFISGTFREAWRRHKRLHAGLAATWLLLGYLVATTGGRDGTAGFGAGVAWWAYALTQFRAIAHYLRLSVWPHPLVGDYGRMLGGPPVEVLCDAALVIALVAGTIWALTKKIRIPKSEFRNSLGFAGAWFFLILAPSSSIVPVATEIIAEHRMYLSLAAVVAVAVVGGWGLFECRRGLYLVICLMVAAGFAFMTHRRNEVYRSSLAFWTDAALKIPENAGAHNNLGNILAEKGLLGPAMAQYREALRLVPEYADAHADLGNALVKEGRYNEAIDNYLVTLRYRPRDASVHYGLGLALMRTGRDDEARDQFEQAVRLNPDDGAAWSSLADLLVAAGRWAGAADAYAAAIRLHPDSADAHVNYGNVLAQLGRRPEAVKEYELALRLQPAAPDVHNNLGSMLAESGRLAEAKAEFEEALRLKPDYQEARDNLERVNALEKGETGQ